MKAIVQDKRGQGADWQETEMSKIGPMALPPISALCNAWTIFGGNPIKK